jgi:hypothetical protein
LGGFAVHVFTKGSEIGGAIIDGILSAIRNGAGAIKDAVVGIAQDALNGVKGFLHIGSPSKVFADQVGTPIVQGIIVGLDDQQRALDRRMKELVKPSAALPDRLGQGSTSAQASQAVLAARGASAAVAAPTAPVVVRMPDRFKADLTIDMGGVHQVVQAEFRALDLQLAAGSQA